jgi:FkbM family methyltransferase
VPSYRRIVELLRSSDARRRVAINRTRSHFFRLARYYTPAVAVDAPEGRYFVWTRDPYVGYYMFMQGSFDAETARRGIAAITSARDEGFDLAGETVLDIGANIGTQTVPFLTTHGAGHVVAVEPDPANATLLRQNLLANGLQDRASVLEFALSDRDGMVELELSPVNPGDHRVRPENGARGLMDEASRGIVSVRAATLDALIGDGSVDLDALAMVWMDTQGHEGHVLAGARRLLASQVPVVTEYWPYGLWRAGGLDTFHALVAEHYDRVIDLQSPWGDRSPRELPATDVASLAASYPGSDDSRSTTTDLVLLS